MLTQKMKHPLCKPSFTTAHYISSRLQPPRPLAALYTQTTPSLLSPSPPQIRRPRSNNSRVPLTLEHFVQRSRALSLYRSIIRGINKLDDSQRAESYAFARSEFERNRNVTDLSHIRYLISTGKTEWEAMHRYVGQ